MTQVVELSGDEKALLQSYDRAIKKQVEYEMALRNGGAAGDAAGTQVEAALEKVRKANDQALKGLLGDLKSLGPEGSAAAEAMKGHFIETGKVGYQSFDKILDQIRAIDPAAADAAAAAKQSLSDTANSSETQFRAVLDELRAMGPEGRQAAEEIKASLVAAGKLSEKSIEGVTAALREIDPEAAAAADAIVANMLNAANSSETQFRAVLDELRAMGPEGRQAAEEIKASLVAAGKLSEKSIEGVTAALREIDPEAAAAADAIVTNMRSAANSSETQFRAVLDELRAMGPEGRQAAEQIKSSLVSAGKLSEKSIEDVTAALRRIDPDAAAAADAIVANMRNGTNSMTGMFKSFGTSAVAEITSVVGAYFGVSEAITLVNEQLEAQRQRIDDLATAQLAYAAAQQDASKNLAGLEKADRLGLLRNAPQIAMDTAISPAIITQALGEVASTGLNDPNKIAEIVKQSAKLNRLKPEELPSSAAGAADIMAKTGLQDIRQTAALFLTTGAQSLVADPSKLQAALPRALGAGIVSAPNQNREEAARETAAIFAQATNVGTDNQGASSATFTIDLLNRMGQFFGGLDRERVQARSRIELVERKIHKSKDTEFDRLKKQEDEAFLNASEGVTDPGTQFGRLAILQRSKDLAQQFTGEKGFGEKQFAPFLKEVLDTNSETAAAVRASKQKILADVNAFEQQAQELVSSTAAQSAAVLQKELAAQREASGLLRTDASTLGTIRSEVAKTLDATALGGVDGLATAFMRSIGLDNPERMGSNASEAAIEAVQRLQVRKGLIASDGITGDDAHQISLIDATIEKVFSFVARDVRAGAIDQKSAGEVAKQAAELSRRYDLDPEYKANMARLAQLMEQVATNTAATAESNQAMVAPSQATAQNTGKTPAATPALGAAANGP